MNKLNLRHFDGREAIQTFHKIYGCIFYIRFLSIFEKMKSANVSVTLAPASQTTAAIPVSYSPPPHSVQSFQNDRLIHQAKEFFSQHAPHSPRCNAKESPASLTTETEDDIESAPENLSTTIVVHDAGSFKHATSENTRLRVPLLRPVHPHITSSGRSSRLQRDYLHLPLRTHRALSPSVPGSILVTVTEASAVALLEALLHRHGTHIMLANPHRKSSLSSALMLEDEDDAGAYIMYDDFLHSGSPSVPLAIHQAQWELARREGSGH